ILHPYGRTVASELWIVDIDSGEQRRIAVPDAMQPKWSPGGRRIAYWAVDFQGSTRGQRDLWTVAVSGGDAIRVTDDPAADWCPVWSPDGRYLYFASDRAGTMNLWRNPMDEETGGPRGSPEPVTTPTPFAAHVSFSGDGAQMAFASLLNASNLYRVKFDPRL